MIDGSTGSEPVLASGALQYLEKQGQPTHSVAVKDGQANFTLKSGGKGQTWMRMPWSACNGATEWQVHLNPTVSLDITRPQRRRQRKVGLERHGRNAGDRRYRRRQYGSDPA